jgi:hypothetical protein
MLHLSHVLSSFQELFLRHSSHKINVTNSRSSTRSHQGLYDLSISSSIGTKIYLYLRIGLVSNRQRMSQYVYLFGTDFLAINLIG